MTSEPFKWTTVPYGDDGKLVRGVLVHCGSDTCDVAGGRVLPLPVPRQKGFGFSEDDKDTGFINKKLEHLGWRVGKSGDDHRCPACYTRAKETAASKAKEKAKLLIAVPAQVVTPTPIKSLQDLPRQMSRDDGRIIFAKLNEVYSDDTTGYRQGWTDKKVAADLGVPLEWVSSVRDEHFGEEHLNDEIRDAIKEGKEIVAEIRQAVPIAEQATATLKRLIGIADRIKKSMCEIEKTVR